MCDLQSQKILGLGGVCTHCVDRVRVNHSRQSVSELSQAYPDVLDLLDDDFLEQGYQIPQLCIILVIKPCLDKDARILLQKEVLCQVVYYDCLGQGSSYLGQILDDQWIGVSLGPIDCVLSVKSVLDNLLLWVQLIDNPVGVLLNTSREYDYLIILRHLL